MKRLVLFLICLALLSSLCFAGCSKTEPTEAKKPASEAKDETNQEEVKPEDAVPGSTGEPGTFPIVDEKIELSVFALQPVYVEDFETNYFTTWYEEKTNVHVNWETTPKVGLKEKRNLLLASGNYPDILFGTDLTFEEQMMYGSQGILIDMKPLIDKWGVELKKHMETIDWLENAITTPDGTILSLPHIDECFHCYYGQKMWINNTWLEQMNLPMPETTEDFKNVMIAFKEQDPNGNGKADEVPLTGALNIWHSEVPDFLMSAFIYCDGDDNTFRVTLKDGVVDCIADRPEFREGLRYINSLYELDLIDPGAFTQNRDQLKQLGEGSEDQVIGAATSGWFGYFSSFDGERHKDYVAVPPLKGPEGVQLCGYYPFGYYTGAFSITNTNPYPEASYRWADWMFGEEGQLAKDTGREGTEWERPAEGEIGINGKPAKWRPLVPLGEVQNITWKVGPAGKTTDFRLSEVRAEDPYLPTGLETRLFDQTQKYVGFEPEEIYPPLYMTTEQIDEMAQIKGALMAYIEESMARFITGDLDIDKDWDSYVKGLENLDMVRYEEICQEAYDMSAYSKK